MYGVSQRKCGFAAYRLTDLAMKRREAAENEDDADAFEGLASEDLLEEVKINIYSSPLIEHFLLSQQQAAKFDSLDLDNVSPGLERNVQLLLESLDEFALQQREMQMHERNGRMSKDNKQKNNNSRVPKAVDTLNLSQQIQSH